MCFVVRRLEVVAVTGLLWISWCVLRGANFFSAFFTDFVFLRTHTAFCKYEATSRLMYTTTSTGVRTRCHYLFSLSVGVRVCMFRGLY